MAATLNYQIELDKEIKKIREAGRIPSLLLHSCCAPCSSYVLEYLSEHFHIYDYYYNPNITDRVEYQKRSDELRSLIERQPHRYPVSFIEGEYDPKEFFKVSKGLETCPEGGERCFRCYELRLKRTAELAAKGFIDPNDGKQKSYDYFTTTLTISPLKNAAKLNEIGLKLSEEFGVRWLPSDFKKRGGYLRSIELSREYNLYRQNYCGCIFSARQSENVPKS